MGHAFPQNVHFFKIEIPQFFFNLKIIFSKQSRLSCGNALQMRSINMGNSDKYIHPFMIEQHYFRWHILFIYDNQIFSQPKMAHRHFQQKQFQSQILLC